MSKKKVNKLPENKKMYIVTLPDKFPRIVFKYNPNAVKKFRDKNGNITSEVKNDGSGYAFTIKLVNGEKIILDTEKQEFIINKLITSGKIKEYEQYLADEENKKILEDMEKDSGTNDSKTTDKE